MCEIVLRWKCPAGARSSNEGSRRRAGGGGHGHTWLRWGHPQQPRAVRAAADGGTWRRPVTVARKGAGGHGKGESAPAISADGAGGREIEPAAGAGQRRGDRPRRGYRQAAGSQAAVGAGRLQG
jgi:hypothetical protein